MCPSQPPPWTKHTQHTVDTRYTQACVVCAPAHVRILHIFVFPKMVEETGLKKQSPEATPRPILTASWTHLAKGSPSQRRRLRPPCGTLRAMTQARWTSVTEVRRPKLPNRHLLMSLLEIGFGRGEEFPSNCTHGAHLQVPLRRSTQLPLTRRNLVVNEYDGSCGDLFMLRSVLCSNGDKILLLRGGVRRLLDNSVR